MTVPAPRRPADNHCTRHPKYYLASCADCRAAQHAEVVRR